MTDLAKDIADLPNLIRIAATDVDTQAVVGQLYRIVKALDLENKKEREATDMLYKETQRLRKELGL